MTTYPRPANEDPALAARKAASPGTRKIEFCTREYQLSHRRTPRGRGSWAFCPHNAYHKDDYQNHLYWTKGSTTYQDAKKEARAHFAGSTTLLIVCP